MHTIIYRNMVYSDFTITKFEQAFGIRQTRADLFPAPVQTITPTQHLLMDLEEAKSLPNFSEKAKSEYIISPILRELIRQNKGLFTIFSGYSLDVNPLKGLNGQCDFLLSTATQSLDIKSPIFSIVEAKNRGVEEGIGQCAAELYAAQQVNEAANMPTPVLYGVITNAFDWLFIRLDEHTLAVDTQRYYIGQLPELLGVMQTIVDLHRPDKLTTIS